MSLRVEEINPNNAKDLNCVDNSFSIDTKLVLHAADDQISYQIVEAPKSKKRYRNVEIDPTVLINDPDQTAFMAYLDGQIAGQIILRLNWNKYAYIEDIAVDIHFRRQGIGKGLISWAKSWAQARGLPGIMLETQNNNLPACKLYERCGFQLGGFDRQLYKGVDRDTEEVALYWYLMF